MERAEVDTSRETLSLSTISGLRVSETRSRVIREWLVRFGTNHERAIAPLIALWEDELADISPVLLEKTFRQVLRTSRFFPTIAEVRAQIDQANANGLHLEIEEAWSRALDWVQRYFHPDLGVARGAPELPGAIQHAIRAAADCSGLKAPPRVSCSGRRSASSKTSPASMKPGNRNTCSPSRGSPHPLGSHQGRTGAPDSFWTGSGRNAAERRNRAARKCVRFSTESRSQFRRLLSQPRQSCAPGGKTRSDAWLSPVRVANKCSGNPLAESTQTVESTWARKTVYGAKKQLILE